MQELSLPIAQGGEALYEKKLANLARAGSMVLGKSAYYDCNI